jgi:hypothetical protein
LEGIYEDLYEYDDGGIDGGAGRADDDFHDSVFGYGQVSG